ncbi:MAG: SMC-Scp complex subunit ScpB [Candidatus Helarchaeota archaeon]
MDHILSLESLFFIRGKKGVSVKDIEKLINTRDMHYILYLISQIEVRLESSVMGLKYNPVNKRFHIMIRPEFIDMLQNLELIKPRLSKAATATLAVIIFYYHRNQQITIDFLESIRGQNVIQHLRELEMLNYTTFNNENKIVNITQKLINEINVSNVTKEIEKLYK